MKNKILLALSIFVAVIGLDRYTKLWAITDLKGQNTTSFLNDLFTLTYHENTGAMLSLGAKLPDNIRFFIFTVLVGICLLIGFGYLFINPMKKYNFILGMIIVAGGSGNLYDRAVYEYVVDFMLLQAGGLRTGVFNIADIAIMVGAFGYMIPFDTIFAKKKIYTQ